MKRTTEQMEAEIRQRFAQHVVRIRGAHGLTREQLAERSSIDVSEIKRIESGIGQVTLTTIAVLADALGVDPVELVVAPPTR